MTSQNAYIAKILKTLEKLYPKVQVELFHRSAFELLVATMLSAQCTDKQVNAVTGRLFAELATPEDFAAVPLERLEALIRSTGFFHNKARNIKKCAKALLETHGGQVPANLQELIKLPGVGRKTANCVLGGAFDIPGMVVDTHVARISRRLGLTSNTDPQKIEFDLMQKIPQKAWNPFSLRLIHFGRAICKARKPLCADCPLAPQCPWPEKGLLSG